MREAAHLEMRFSPLWRFIAWFGEFGETIRRAQTHFFNFLTNLEKKFFSGLAGSGLQSRSRSSVSDLDKWYVDRKGIRRRVIWYINHSYSSNLKRSSAHLKFQVNRAFSRVVTRLRQKVCRSKGHRTAITKIYTLPVFALSLSARRVERISSARLKTKSRRSPAYKSGVVGRKVQVLYKFGLTVAGALIWYIICDVLVKFFHPRKIHGPTPLDFSKNLVFELYLPKYWS